MRMVVAATSAAQANQTVESPDVLRITFAADDSRVKMRKVNPAEGGPADVF